jgi:hypothetical protein
MYCCAIPSEAYPFQSLLVITANNISFSWQQGLCPHPVTG